MEIARELTSLDRCDRCGARALVATEHRSAELLWCGHHYAAHRQVLGEYVTSVHEDLLIPVSPSI